MKLIYHPDCLQYSTPGHPESPQRIKTAYNFLKDKYDFLTPEPATDKQILVVHTPTHINQLKSGNFSNLDSPNYPDIYSYAALSAGAAIMAMQNQSFSLMRPPGHHAGPKTIAGFCYLNNLAIAIKVSQKPTLIIDIDGHHGDGTQAIFLNNPQIIYLSLHTSPNYPGTGLTSQANCHNYPLPLNCGDQVYLETLNHALNKIDLSRIQQIAVSAGFDTYEKDPLASLGLTTQSYKNIGKIIQQLNLPTFAVLEGGYHSQSLGPNIHSLLQGLSL